MIVAYVVAVLYTLQQILPMVLLGRFLRRGRRFELVHGPTSLRQEGISVLMPVRGHEPHLRETIRALVDQDYAGPVEIVLAFQDEKDPDLFIAEEFEARYGACQRRHVKVLRGLPALGLNYKNSNLEHARRAARYEWLYCCDADTKADPTHLRRALTLAQEKQARAEACFITAISVHERPVQPGAWLEAVGTNMEFANYFLLSHLSPKAGALNGASMFFHADTLAKIGGFPSYLDKITDDLAMQGAFVQMGAHAVLLPSLARVTLERQSIRGFFARQSRWQLIARCFDPKVFYIFAPTNWVGQWLLLAAAFSGSLPLAVLGLAILGVRLLRSLLFQIALRTPRRDWGKAVCLPVYDLVSPLIWFNTVILSQVQWAGTTLRVGRDGTLHAIRAATAPYIEVPNVSK